MANRKINDILGKTYGTLKVIREVDPRTTSHNQKITRVECKCLLCGKIIVKDAAEVRRFKNMGHRGCSQMYHKNNDMTVDIIGKTFGNWKVLEELRDESNYNTRMCKCECQCKNKTIAMRRKYDLLAGRTKGCTFCSAQKKGEARKSENVYDLTHAYGIGYTDKNEPFYFDLEDYDLIKNFHWYIDKEGYVHSNYINDNKIKHIKMHRLVMNVSNPQIIIDHIGHNTTDNRKCMLRVCSMTENVRNHIPLKDKKSPTGVSFKKKEQKWVASIGFNRKVIYLGSYDNLEDAIEARKKAEEKYYKEFSYTNSMKIAERNKIKGDE